MIFFFRFVLIVFLLSGGSIFAAAQSFESVIPVLDPAAFGIEAGAVEVPSLRTEKTVTFRLPNGDFTQISDGTDRFTRDEHGSMVPVRDIGEQTQEGILFNRLPQETTVLFESDAPAYTYHYNGHFFRLSFAGHAKATFETPNSVSYQLADHAILRFTVKGATIQKAITINGPIDSKVLNFEITQDQDLLQRSQSSGLVLETATGVAIFRASAPSLLDASGALLEHPIRIRSLGSGHYSYNYDPKDLPSVYIIDPSTGYSSPGTVANDSSIGTSAWTNPTLASSSDDAYAKTVAIDTISNYLKATNFSFALPSATVNGVRVSVERHGYDAVSIKDSEVKLVQTGSIVGNNKADTSTFWPASDAIKNYGGIADLWGLQLNSSQVNRSDFGVALAIDCFEAICGQRMEEFTVFVDHITLSVTYTLKQFGDICTVNSECASGPCRACGPAVYEAPCGADPPGTLKCATHCGCIRDGYGITVSPGFSAVLANDESVDMTVFDNYASHNGANVRFKKGSTRIADMAMGYGCAGPETNFTPQMNTSDQKTYFHVPSYTLGGTGYILYVPKSVSHDQVRVCSGAVVLGCTSTGSWSFYSNDQGQLTANGGFSTTNITAAVTDGYWKINGLTSTGGEGEGSGNGGSAVPEFSAIGLVAVLAICGYIMKMRLTGK